MKMLALFLFLITNSIALKAHEGPPFPILVDKKINDGILTIWADPDTGEGTFYLYLEGAGGQESTIELIAKPQNIPSFELSTQAARIDATPKRSTYKAILPFDRPLMWKVEFRIKQNGNMVQSIILPVEVTPPGANKLEFAVYLLPFLMIGFIWVKIVMVKLKKSTS